MTHKLHILALSDQDYEDLIAECYIDDVCVMTINQEHGPDKLEVEILARLDGQPWHIEYNDLVELLQKAKTRLWELRRIPVSGVPGKNAIVSGKNPIPTTKPTE